MSAIADPLAEYGPAIPHRCSANGCKWESTGGCHRGCVDANGDLVWGGCSVPVHECPECGDCDYGDNEEANEKRAECARWREAGLQ